MAIEDFLRTWRVVKPPVPDGESEGHQVKIERNGHSNGVKICCMANPGHPLRHGTYSTDSDQIVGEGFRIALAPPSVPPRIVCLPGNAPNTGSWTAEDTSGEGQSK
jgi:hypothetical protein